MSQDQFSALHEVKINLIPSILGTALLEPATQPRATGLSRCLMRRRELRLQGSAGFFLQKIYHGDELKRPVVCALNHVWASPRSKQVSTHQRVMLTTQ